MDREQKGKVLAELFNKYRFNLYNILGLIISLLLIVLIITLFLLRQNSFNSLLLLFVFLLIGLASRFLFTYLSKRYIEKREQAAVLEIYGKSTIPWPDYDDWTLMIFNGRDFFRGFFQNYWGKWLFLLGILIFLLPFCLFASYIVILWLIGLLR